MANLERAAVDGDPVGEIGSRRNWRRVLLVVGVVILVLAGLFALYGWRAVSEYRTFEAIWVEYDTDMDRILEELVDRREAYEDFPRTDHELSRLLDSFDEGLHHTEASRLQVQDTRGLTFGGREIRAAMEETLDLTAQTFANVRGTLAADGSGQSSARLDARRKAVADRLEHLMANVRGRWQLKPSPNLDLSPH